PIFPCVSAKRWSSSSSPRRSARARMRRLWAGRARARPKSSSPAAHNPKPEIDRTHEHGAIALRRQELARTGDLHEAHRQRLLVELADIAHVVHHEIVNHVARALPRPDVHADAHAQPRLFQHLAHRRLRNRLAVIDASLRKGPLPATATRALL